jgi:PAS domain S-box-containing protein
LKIETNQIVGKTDYDFFPKDIAEKYIASDKKVMQTGMQEDLEDHHIQNGIETIVHIVKTPVRDEQGNIFGVLGILKDITEQKKKEEELKKERAYLNEQISEYSTKLQTLQERIQQESNERRRVEEELLRLKEGFKESRANLEKQILEAATALYGANEKLQKEISERKRIEEVFQQTEEDLKKLCTHLEGRLLERTADLQTVNEQLQSINSERQRLEEKLRSGGENLRALEEQISARTTEWQTVKEELQMEIGKRQRLEYEQGMAAEKINTFQGQIHERTTELQIVKEHLQEQSDAHRKLEEELRKKAEEINRLVRENALTTEIGKIVGSTMDLKEVYDRFSEFASEVERIIPFDRITTTILNSEDKTLNITYASGLDMAHRRAGDVLPLAGTSAEEIMRTRNSLIIRKENKEEAIGRFPDLLNYFEAGFQSLLFVPMISQNQLIGILNLLSTKPDVYSHVDLRLAERVGNQMAGAITNAKHSLENKWEQETLKASEQKYCSGLNLAPVGIWVGVQGRISFANSKYSEILGYSQEELLSKPLMELLHPHDQEKMLKKYSCWATGEGLPGNYVARFIHKQGHTKWLESKVAFLQWEGKPAMINFVNDITERKLAGETLIHSMEPFRALVQSVEKIICTLEQEKE